MRNISFDESTVLRELSRILDGGLKKQAAESLPAPDMNEVKPTVQSTFEDQLRAFPLVAGVYAGQKPNNGTELLKELDSMEFRRFKEGWAKSNSPADVQKLQKLVSKLVPILQGIQRQVKGMPSDFQSAYLPKIEDAMKLLSKASIEVATKTAADKHYDVTGETGEDLIENAHGHGMKTELTHSKTPDALVENLVEQQKADIAVVNKMPKGTYATLVGLYNKLNKMGLNNELNELRETIKAVASLENVLEHTLVTLADELDTLGFAVQANVVDELLKKVADPLFHKAPADFGADTIKSQFNRINSEATQKLLNETLKNMSDATRMHYYKAIEDLRAKSFFEASKMLSSITQADASAHTAFNQAMGEVGDLATILAGLKKQMESDAAKGITTDEVTINVPQKTKPQFSKKVLEFQKAFNAQTSSGSEKLVEDGILGPKTRSALKMMGGWEGWSEHLKDVERGETRIMPPKPAEGHNVDFSVVFRKLLRAFDIKFHNAQYTSAPAINDYLNEEAKKIVQKYNSTPGVVPTSVDMWVNQAIAGLTKEDVEEAARG